MKLDDLKTRQAVTAERAFLHGLGGGCAVPIAALGLVQDVTLTLRGAVLSADGNRRIADQVTGPAESADALGQQLAQVLLDRGAGQLLGACP
jgi:hydroxymethylbilane synthase